MKKSVAIIGGGPAGMAAAAFLDPSLFDVHIYEKNKALGRKFLVAGKGGFNLTHSEPVEDLIDRYTPNDFLRSALLSFTNKNFRDWLCRIEVPTFVGSSKRVYPQRGIKPIEVLQAILKKLEENQVTIHYNSEWMGWDGASLIINQTKVNPDITIFSLGGGSWSITGSDGTWLHTFERNRISVRPFLPSNCGYVVPWQSDFKERFSGFPLKNIAFHIENKYQKGEVVITDYGIEGNAIYALSHIIRKHLINFGKLRVYLDAKPTLNQEVLLQKLKKSKRNKITDILKRDLNLAAPLIELIKQNTSKIEYQDLEFLAHFIKSIPIPIIRARPLDEAISTVGGIHLNEINAHYQLKQKLNTYCIGEMLDWDAPTGGYLLQACFSMGVYLGRRLNEDH